MEIMKCFLVGLYVVCAIDYLLDSREESGIDKFTSIIFSTFLIGSALLEWSSGL